MIHPLLMKRMIEYKFRPYSIAAALLISERNGHNRAAVEAYLEKWPMGEESLWELINTDCIRILDGQPINALNAVMSPKYTLDRAESMELAEELWDAYPATFPLSDGGMFIARKGTDKYEVLKTYLERINHSEEKHRYVLEQLKTYVKLVLERKINGHRIHDWISNEMWDIIPDLLAGSKGEFKTDI